MRIEYPFEARWPAIGAPIVPRPMKPIVAPLVSLMRDCFTRKIAFLRGVFQVRMSPGFNQFRRYSVEIAMNENDGMTPTEGAGQLGEHLELVETQPQPDERDQMIAILKDEVTRTKDEMLRQLAEAQNIQRRMRQQMEQDRKYAIEGLVRELVPVLDNFDRSLAAAEQGASPESVIDGIRAMQKSLQRALEPVGLVRVAAIGQAFDPEVHEALATVETSEIAPDMVTDEIEPGYMIADRVIRPARVRVSKAPEA
jgi:molecular chaperone GrpE